MLAVDYWKKHGAIIEPALIAKSDLCVANSTYLADYCRKYNPQSYYVGQGCDLEIFMDGAMQMSRTICVQSLTHELVMWAHCRASA
jgi:hypothetical protein